ncbi:MAG: Tm-1-like ATP-binding domain-containing protein [Pirellulales bacterium]
MSIYLLATLDTKGDEAEFVRRQLASHGAAVTLVDVGCLGKPAVAADIPREQVYSAAGASLAEVQQRGDRGHAVTIAAAGAAAVVSDAFAAEKVSGVLGLGGSAGSTIASAAMRALPLGVPKLLVSTLASGQVRHYVGDKDILMLNAVVDIAGINRISRAVLGNAAAAMAGMVRARETQSSAAHDGATADKPLVAATMFGVTTPCVEAAKRILADAGYEVVVFHAVGSGGQAMESLIRDGLFAGVLDITTTELADELVGGVLSAGPNRLTAAAEKGVPQVVSVGATDMVNFHAAETVPAEFADRKFYQHNASVTLMRTTADECAAIGGEIGRMLAAARGPVAVFLPANGVSAIDAKGQPFDDPAARSALFTAIRTKLAEAGASDCVEVVELDQHINDAAFAEAMARRLLAMLRAR